MTSQAKTQVKEESISAATDIPMKKAALSRLLNQSERDLKNYNYANYNNEYNANNQNNNQYVQAADIEKYSIQFQGCHTIKHWNKDAADEDDIRVSTKRLVRYRLVPYASCSKYNPWLDESHLLKSIKGADYGDYVVDMDTFVAAYLDTKAEYQAFYAGDDDVNNGDDGNDGDGNDQYYGYRKLYYNDDGNNAFDINDYATCAAFDFDGTDDMYMNDEGNAVQYYMGPYCAAQGGSIKFNLFTDDTCSTLAKCNGGSTRGADCYKSATGNDLPYSKDSLVEDPCIPCSENYIYLMNAPKGGVNQKTYDFGYPRDSCSTLYDASGKCETNMKSGEYDYACDYIKGIKVGTSAEGYAIVSKRSTVADGFIGLFVVGIVFVAMYIVKLKNILKLHDSKHYKGSFYVESKI